MFAYNHKKDVTVTDGTVRIKKLSGDQLEDAGEARSTRRAAGLRTLGGDILKAMQTDEAEKAAAIIADKRAKAPTVEERLAERYDSYDRRTVLRHGVVSWSFPVDVNLQSLGEIQDEDKQTLHKEILDYTLGPILDAAASEAAESKG